MFWGSKVSLFLIMANLILSIAILKSDNDKQVIDNKNQFFDRDVSKAWQIKKEKAARPFSMDLRNYLPFFSFQSQKPQKKRRTQKAMSVCL